MSKTEFLDQGFPNFFLMAPFQEISKAVAPLQYSF